MSFTRFVNDTEMVSFSAFWRAIGWFIAVTAFTATACALMLRGSESWGLQLAVSVLGGLFAASGAGAVNYHTQRKTAKEYGSVAEAKERGKQKSPMVNTENVEKVEIKAADNEFSEGAREEHEWAEGDPRAGVL